MSHVVPTAAGPVAGRSAAGVRSWRGIPYATADRFAPATPARPWTAPLDATRPGPVGIQRLPGGGLAGTESCLTLDVYAPEGTEGPLPVLFWIHGGAFQTGAAADYDATVLAATGPAVVVAVSYRLGPFGFLQLGTAGDPLPSPAITDLLAALEWVHREIAAFGGDVDRLTLMGQSAGASLVCALLATPAGRRASSAIAFSYGGSPLEPAAAVDVAERVLAELGLARTDLAGLRFVPAAEVMAAAASAARGYRRQSLGGVLFGPTLDGDVLPASPAETVRSGQVAHLNLWLGSCRDEMTMFLGAGGDDAVAVARGRIGAAAFDELAAVYRATAVAGEDPLQALLTDEMWVRPAWDMAESQAAAGGRAWLSRFDHSPALPPFDELGPTHGADNACLWAHPPRFVERPLLARPAADMTPTDLEVTSALHASVLSMVRAGTPASGSLRDWAPYDADSRATAVFDARTRVESDPSGPRRRAWAEATRIRA